MPKVTVWSGEGGAEVYGRGLDGVTAHEEGATADAGGCSDDGDAFKPTVGACVLLPPPSASASASRCLVDVNCERIFHLFPRNFGRQNINM